MKILKGILLLIMVSVIMIAIIASCDRNVTSTSSRVVEGNPVKVAVFSIDFTDEYISIVRKNLEDIQKENEGKVEFIFYDGKSNEAIQNEQIDKVLKEGTDLILLNLISYRE